MSSSDSQFEYRLTPWGELIRGKKDELQSLGIAVGMAFPGELGGPNRKLNVLDPRGLKATVERLGDDGYTASIMLPGRELPKESWMDSHAGVKLSRTCYGDVYVGSAEALAAAGIVSVDQLPGQPGARKVTVTVHADGTIPAGPPTANNKRADEVGAKMITRATKDTFRVIVKVDEATRRARWELSERTRADYEARMASLPRPAPLTASGPIRERKVRGHLSLVWSAQSAVSHQSNGCRL